MVVVAGCSEADARRTSEEARVEERKEGEGEKVMPRTARWEISPIAMPSIDPIIARH